MAGDPDDDTPRGGLSAVMDDWWTVAVLSALDAVLWAATVPRRTPSAVSRRLEAFCRGAPGRRAIKEGRSARGAAERLRFGRRAARVRALRTALPDALEIVATCLRAGLGLHAAVAEYAQTASGVAAEAFRGYLAELTVGRTPEDALRDLARRYPADEMAAVAAAVAQSLRVGAPLADVFEAQAAQCRALALHRAREGAQKLSTQLVLPLVVFVFPVVFIVGLGPVALRVARLTGTLR